MEAILLAVIKIVPTIFMALFPVVNPIGTALVLSAKSKTVPSDVMKKISIKIAIYSFFVLSTFFLFGNLFLKLFGITTQIVQVSGGLVLTFMAWQLLNSNESKTSVTIEDEQHILKAAETKCFYPLTFPLTVGPGCLAIVITFGSHLRNDSALSFAQHLAGLLGIFLICLTVYFCYANIKFVVNKFSREVTIAISKMAAFFVICIGIEIFWNGLKNLLKY